MNIKKDATDGGKQKNAFLFARGRFHSADPMSIVGMAPSADGKVRAMRAQLARFVISLVAMLIALVIFVKMDVGWLSAALMAISLLSGFGLAEVTFRRLADHETIRQDLEERVRNQHL